MVVFVFTNFVLAYPLFALSLVLCALGAVVVVNELRSEAVHSQFTTLFEQHFTIKRTPRSKMDSVHQHSAIDILILKRRRQMVPATDTITKS